MRRAFFVGVLLVLALPACRKPRAAALAGERVGSYRVEYDLDDNSCGAGYAAPASLDFQVELRAEPMTDSGYWKLPTGPLVSGRVERGDSFRFEQRSTAVAIPSDPPNGITGCTLERLETVRGEFEAATATTDGGAASDAEARLDGTTTVRVTPVAGSDCTPALAILGGPFSTLPCEVRYELTGERVPGT